MIGSFWKTPRYRNQAVLDHAKNIERCTFCDKQPEPGSIVAAHSNLSAHGKGSHRKADDIFVAYLCMECHDAIDASRKWNEVAIYIFTVGWSRSLPQFQHLLDEEGKNRLAEYLA
jgi:hypothetical protein